MTDTPLTSNRIFEALARFFAENEWPATRLGDQTVLQLAFQGAQSRWLCYAQAREETQQFVFYSVCPITIPAEKRPVIAEYITRANYGLILGNFELDFEDGELRYKTSLDVEESELTLALLKPVVFANITTMDRYLPGIMSLIYGKASPLEAVAQVESGE